MDTFIPIISGNHQHHVGFTIQPQSFNSVCCSSKYISIMQYRSPLLSVYNWSATHLCDIDHTKLGLPSGGYLHAAGSFSEDSIVLFDSNITLHSYKVT